MQVLERTDSSVVPFDRSAKPVAARTDDSALRLAVSPARVAVALTAIVAALTALSVAGQFTKYYLGHDRVFGLVHLFNVSHEGNVPTWYSSFSLLCCAVLLALIAFDERASGGRRARQWTGLSLLLLYAAIDEGARIHELLNAPLRAAFDTHGLLYYPAAVAGGACAVILAAVYARFFWSLPPATRMLFLVSAAVYLGGAVGVESISAWHAERFGQQNMTYALITTVEELGEMLGVVIFVYALLSYMAEHTRAVTISATAGRADRIADSRRAV